MTSSSPQESSASIRLLAKAWFGLASNERWAIGVVLGLFLLGLGARAWHLSCVCVSVQPPVSETRLEESQK